MRHDWLLGKILGASRGLVLLVALIAILIPHAAEASRNKSKQPQENRKYAAIVIDARTGQVLMADNPDKQLHPASLTKMMTLLLTFDALTAGTMRTNDYIRVSNRAAGQTPSKLGVPAGGRLRVDDAIRSIAIKSANDISVAMAEALAGSERRFAEQMTARAKEIGMSRTRFVNASGLHNPFQVSTARDMATLSRYIIMNYPQYYKYFGLKSFNYGGRSHTNHNRLMGTYRGMDGMKTGYIGASGFNLAASAVRGERRLIGVVFGGRTAKSRNAHMAKILDESFAKPVRVHKPKIDVATLTPYPETRADGVVPTDDMAASVAPRAGAAATATAAKAQRRVTQWAAIPARKPEIEQGSTPSQIVRTPSIPATRSWAVQLGAYQNRDATDRALYQAAKRLPRALAHATPIVAPLKSAEAGWVFRARLGNLSQADAGQICQIFAGCLMLPPTAHHD
jgi:D-alanyl-D-alanine carboxypeptidase